MTLKTLATGVTATLALSTIGSMATAKTRIIVNCFWPPQHFVCQEVLPGWLDAVEEVTEGRVVGNIPPKSVAPPPEQLASVEKGIVDASIQFNGLIANRVNGALTAMQPFSGSSNGVAMTQAAWETREQFYPDEFDTVELLSQWVITPGQLYSNTDSPIVTVDDFKSRKMWALPGPLANMAKAIGAAVVATPAVKSNEVISNGVVDSHMGLGGDAIQAFQIIPYTKSMTQFSTPVYSTSFSFVMNKDKWAEISAEDQAAIRALSQDQIGMFAAGLWDSTSAGVYAKFDELGIALHAADPALEQTLVDAAGPITAAWKAKASEAGIDAEAALSFYRQRVQELSQ